MVGDESSTGSGGGFRSCLHYFLYNGKKKHVFAGIAIISVVFVVPLYFMTIGAPRSYLLLKRVYSDATKEEHWRGMGRGEEVAGPSSSGDATQSLEELKFCFLTVLKRDIEVNELEGWMSCRDGVAVEQEVQWMMLRRSSRVGFLSRRRQSYRDDGVMGRRKS
ncbi:hypothetical protein KSP39_PZI007831 [Platanthera zijinensis]|uniref:Uncharacterized protein n=1 Tax=Platanthera zijinensis TaxID=2320716 RepID=A0AAP0BPI7_9ASPA